MGSQLRRIVSVSLALVLSGTPAVVVVCAALCGPVSSAGHADHHLSVEAALHASHAEPVGLSDAVSDAEPASPDAHQHHHDTSETADTPQASDRPVTGAGTGASFPAAVVASVRDCCSDLEGVTSAPARVQARSDTAAPFVAVPATDSTLRVVSASGAYDPPVSPHPPPAPVRAPLILRI